MATFPNIKPAARSYNPGDYAQQRYRTLSGAVWKRSFSDTRTGMTLSLEFSNIPDTSAQQILAHYEEQGGTLYRFALPGNVYAGMSSALQASVKIPANSLWAYAEPPEVQSVQRGTNTVRVSLVGEVKY